MTQKLQFEIADSKLYLGLSYSIFANKLKFQRDTINEVYDEIPDEDKVGRVATFTPILTYDTRDSIFTPNNGIYANLYYEFYRKSLGGNYDFDL